MFGPLAVVVLGADKDGLDPVPILHGHRVEESKPFGKRRELHDVHEDDGHVGELVGNERFAPPQP